MPDKHIGLMACRDARDYVAATRHLSEGDRAVILQVIEERIVLLQYVDTLHTEESHMSMQVIPVYAGGTGYYQGTLEMHQAEAQGGEPSYRAEVARLRHRLHNLQGQIEDVEHGYYIITPEGDWYGPEPTEARIRRCSQSDFRDTRHVIALVMDKVDAIEED